MFVDHTVFMTFGHSKLDWVSYRPPTTHFCFTPPLEFLTAPKEAVPLTLGTTGLAEQNASQGWKEVTN